MPEQARDRCEIEDPAFEPLRNARGFSGVEHGAGYRIGIPRGRPRGRRRSRRPQRRGALFHADPALRADPGLGVATGRLSIPLLSVKTTGDLWTPISLDRGYARRVRAQGTPAT